MEFVVSNKNYKELNRIRIGIIESYLDTKVEYSSYDKIGTNSQLVTIDIDEEIKEQEKKTIMKLMEKIDYCYKFLYKGYELPIKQLKSMNYKYHKIMNYKDTYYYNPNDLNEELEEFAHIFLKKFSRNLKEVKIPDEQVTTILALDKVGLVPCIIDNENARLYLEIDGEKHHMEYEQMSDQINIKMKDSNLEPHYDIESNIDRINIDKLITGKPPISAYYPNVSTTYHTFKLTLAFSKMCKEENLPMLNCRDIITFSQDVLGFEYYTINTVIKLKEVYEKLEFKNFREHEFEYLENALAFSIYLAGFNIKNFIIENKSLNHYTVCYIYSTLLDPYVNIDDMKQRILDNYVTVHLQDRDPYTDKKFKHMSIQELLSCVMVRDFLIFDKHNIHHVSPFDNKALPLSYYEMKGCEKHSIYNIGNIIKGIFKNPPIFDRNDLELREVEIILDNGKVKIHGVDIAKNMFFSDSHKAMKHIHKIWKKGYFLNSLGLMYYLESGNYAKQTIKAPEWFTLDNTTEHNFYKFLRFNDL
jgi:hypothetical protein